MSFSSRQQNNVTRLPLFGSPLPLIVEKINGGKNMRCLYREKMYICGDYVEVDIFPVFSKQRSRAKKMKPTSEVQARLNQRNAERKLIRLLNANFTKDDIRLDLTYNDDNLPLTPEDAQKEMQNFFRRIKRYRKRLGLPELKYVAVTEIGKETARLHHHIVMSGGVPINDLAEIWGKGYTTVKPLQFDKFGIVGIAVYLVKNPILGKRWNASRNLVKPTEAERTGRLSARKIEKMCSCENTLAEELERIYTRSEDNLKAYASGQISSDECKAARKAFEAEKAEVEKMLSAEIESHYEGYSFAGFEHLLNSFNYGHYLSVKLYKPDALKNSTQTKRRKKGGK